MPKTVLKLTAGILFAIPILSTTALAKGPPEKLTHSATPAVPATPATPADPKSGTPAQPAKPATPAIPPFGRPPPVSNN